jgi:hypothetical protein
MNISSYLNNRKMFIKFYCCYNKTIIYTNEKFIKKKFDFLPYVRFLLVNATNIWLEKKNKLILKLKYF